MHYFISLALAFTIFLAPIQATTAKPDVVIYTIPGCMGCGMAKSFLEERGIPFKEINLRGRPDLYAEMKQRAGGNPDESMTVPRVFINGKHIGGYSELSDYDFEALHKEEASSNSNATIPNQAG